MALSIIAPPATRPVTLAAIKQHLRLDQDEEDEYLNELIDGATAHVETYIRQFLISRTCRQYVDGSNAEWSIELDAWPVSEVVTVTVYDGNGDPRELATGEYSLTRSDHGANVHLKSTLSIDGISGGIEVDFVAGFGESGLDLPSNVVRAIYLIVSHWYEFRGASGNEHYATLPLGIERLLNPTRRIRL